MVSFMWPEMLLTLVLVPVAITLYLWLLGRRKKQAVRYSGLGLVREAMGRGPGWRRHVPPALLLLALTLLLIATARPSMRLVLPSQQRMVVLAMDVSISMRATDVEPTRMAAAQAAAREFIEAQPASTRIGLVSFAGSAALVQPPTFSKDDLLAAIDRFTFQRGTAVGSGILISLQTIFPDLDIDMRTVDPLTGLRDSRQGMPLGSEARDAKPAPPPPSEPGSFKSAAIILLTDGQTTTGPDPLAAARLAADRGVRVFTVGVGTDKGEILVGEGWSVRVRLDEDSLRNIAKITGGEYYYAGTAGELKKVYQELGSRLTLERRETEVSGIFAGLGAVLMLVAAGLSLLWFHRVV